MHTAYLFTKCICLNGIINIPVPIAGKALRPQLNKTSPCHDTSEMNTVNIWKALPIINAIHQQIILKLILMQTISLEQFICINCITALLVLFAQHSREDISHGKRADSSVCKHL